MTPERDFAVEGGDVVDSIRHLEGTIAAPNAGIHGGRGDDLIIAPRSSCSDLICVAIAGGDGGEGWRMR